MSVSILEGFKENNEFKLKKINMTPLEKSKQEELVDKERKEEVFNIANKK